MRSERRIARPAPRLKKRMVGRKGFQRPMARQRFSVRVIDRFYLRQALRLAQQAAARGEVPVGAVLVRRGRGRVLAGMNAVELRQSGVAHAELLVLEEAAARFGRRLGEFTLYVTLEPCTMCAGAMLHARLGRLVFGAPDPARGGAGSQFDILGDARNLHRVNVTGGVMEDEARTLLQRFFQARRKA